MLLFFGTVTALAGVREDCEQSKDPDRAIKACTQLIQQHPRDKVAYYKRGDAYRNKKEYDRAIADYTKAVEIDPEYADALLDRASAYDAKGEFDRAIAEFDSVLELQHKKHILSQYGFLVAYDNRGDAYRHKEEYDRAIADYNKAIEIDPKGAGYYSDRGYARFCQGEFKDAAADLLHSLELKDDTYPTIFRFLARSRAGETAASELEANAARLKTNEWPYAVIELYLGRRQPDATLEAASKDTERCEAQFYIGEWHLLRNETTEAATALRVAADTCPKTFVEHDGAIAELKRLKP